jgi:hypothetical protein
MSLHFRILNFIFCFWRNIASKKTGLEGIRAKSRILQTLIEIGFVVSLWPLPSLSPRHSASCSHARSRLASRLVSWICVCVANVLRSAVNIRCCRRFCNCPSEERGRRCEVFLYTRESIGISLFSTLLLRSSFYWQR